MNVMQEEHVAKRGRFESDSTNDDYDTAAVRGGGGRGGSPLLRTITLKLELPRVWEPLDRL